MTDKRLIKKRYISMSVVLIGLSLVLLLLPKKYSSKELKPDKLLSELNDNTRFISTDKVADMIINSDPALQLIDVRTPEEYKKFSLPGAINIPLSTILDKNKKGKYKWADVLDQDTKTNVFYSNGSIYANQTWMITRRLNYQNNLVLEGGLNKWVETIMRPQRPKKADSDEEFALYSTRKAASMFFGGGTAGSSESGSSSDAPKPVVKKKKHEAEEEGGC